MESGLHVVGIGASAGGLDAVQQLFDNIPKDTGMTYVIIQHLSPDFKSLMPELLAKHTKMEIFTAEDKQTIKPNCIYLNQRNKNLHIKGHKLFLLDKGPKHNLNLPIDIFFHTLGEEFKDKSVGIILSGTGSDGSRGIKTIKEAGGTIIVQDPASAQFDGMPNTAISTNLVDFILRPEKIAEVLAKIPGQRLLLNANPDKAKSNDITYFNILEEIHKFSGIDFRQYKSNTLLRRLEKRMNINNVNQLYDYYILLKNNNKEKEILKQDFLIGVTSFFRDIEAFEQIKKVVIPEMLRIKKDFDPIRIWIPGCSTGEEVFSIAILLDDHIRTHKLNHDFKIFATDVDGRALNAAGLGGYPINISSEIEKQYLDNYFLKSGDKIQIIKRIREKIVFSNHNLLKDPPFIRMDLITCRNLLIYLDNKAQKKALLNFQFALNKFGYLFLGNSESLGDMSKFFKVVDSKWKIYQSISDNKLIPSSINPEDKITTLSYKSPIRTIEQPQYRFKDNPETIFQKYLSSRFSPSSIFIDKDFNIHYIQGDAGERLQHHQGLFQNNLLKMVSPELAAVIRNGIRRLAADGKDIVIKDIVLKNKKDSSCFDLTFHKPEKDDLNEIYLVHFSEDKQVPQDFTLIENIPHEEVSKQRLEDLENELKATKSELQNVVEELETSNEELQSSNEELMASNEELQSTNEELQSVNEELYTVNSELQEKNKELQLLNNDITNLLDSTEIATLFLDTDLRIRKFTPALIKHFQLHEYDIGRPIASFASNFNDDARQSIINNSQKSLDKITIIEQEIKDVDNNHYLIRFSPFITTNKKIDGVVITLVNITELKEKEIKLQESEKRFKQIFEISPYGKSITELDGRLNVNPMFSKITGYSEDELNKTNWKSITHPDDIEVNEKAIKEMMETNKAVKFKKRYIHKDGNIVWTEVRLIANRDINGKALNYITTVVDITELLNYEHELIEAKKKAEVANIYKNQFLANMSHEIRTPMNGVVGFADLLDDDTLTSDERKKYVEIIKNGSTQLLNLINDIIDISKIEAGELQLVYKPCNLKEMCENIESTFNEIRKKKGKENIDFIACVPKSASDLVIETDPFRLQQVLSNLLGNALKFSEKGNIEFGYIPNKDTIKFYVKDHGIGIPQDKLEIIFNRFEQIHQNDQTLNDGTGLGLSISRGIIELLNGKYHVESEEGEGTTVHFEIPFKQAVNTSNSEKKKQLKDISLNNIKMLVVDDEPVNIEYFKSSFKDFTNTLLYATNGKEAVDVYVKNQDIDIVLMDIKMPVMDGFEAAKLILEYNPSAKIIAQTAYAMSTDKDKCLENGFVGYMAKPIDKNNLVELIQSLMNS